MASRRSIAVKVIGVIAVAVPLFSGVFFAGYQIGHDVRGSEIAEVHDLETKVQELGLQNRSLRTTNQRLEQISVSASAALCPAPSQFQVGQQRAGGTFYAKELPKEGSAVVLQMTIEQDRQVVSICKDHEGRFWYFNRGAKNPLVGMVSSAVPTRVGFQSAYVFEDGPVDFEVNQNGVTVSKGASAPLTLPLNALVCFDEKSMPDEFRRWAQLSTKAGPCSVNVTRLWTF